MIGHRELRASDPDEQRMREAYYTAREAGDMAEADLISAKLSNYLWKRTEAEVAADRKKHPKAKRNLPVGHDLVGPSQKTRHLP